MYKINSQSDLDQTALVWLLPLDCKIGVFKLSLFEKLIVSNLCVEKNKTFSEFTNQIDCRKVLAEKLQKLPKLKHIAKKISKERC